MNFSDIYSDKLSTLDEIKARLEEKIYEKEVEMLKSPDLEPKLITWLAHNLDGALVYIPHVRDQGDRGDVLGMDEYDNHPVYWNNDYIHKIFPEQDRYDYLLELQDDANSWDVCQLSIELIPGHYVHLTYDDEIQESYEYTVEYCVDNKYLFMADILEKLLIENREHIWDIYYAESTRR